MKVLFCYLLYLLKSHDLSSNDRRYFYIHIQLRSGARGREGEEKYVFVDLLNRMGELCIV